MQGQHSKLIKPDTKLSWSMVPKYRRSVKLNLRKKSQLMNMQVLRMRTVWRSALGK